MLSFLTCVGAGRISVSEIESGRDLERARPSTVIEFFERRMSNRPRKANVGSWQILHATEDTVYYGYPVFANLLSGSRAVDALYRVDRSLLASEFPGYARITGLEVKSSLYDALKKEKCELRDVQANWKVNLEQSRIRVEVPCADSRIRYRAFFRATDGSFLEFFPVTQ